MARGRLGGAGGGNAHNGVWVGALTQACALRTACGSARSPTASAWACGSARRGGGGMRTVRGSVRSPGLALAPHPHRARGGGGSQLTNTRPRLSSLRLVAQCPGQFLLKVWALRSCSRLRRAYVLPLALAHNRDCNASPDGLTATGAASLACVRVRIAPPSLSARFRRWDKLT